MSQGVELQNVVGRHFKKKEKKKKEKKRSLYSYAKYILEHGKTCVEQRAPLIAFMFWTVTT